MHHRCQRHRWQIMGTISGCRNLKVNLQVKIYIYVSSTTQRWPNKIIENFLIDDFYHLPPVSLTPVANLELRISPRILEKIRNGRNSGAGGKLIHEKNQKQKISWHCPFKRAKPNHCFSAGWCFSASHWFTASQTKPIDLSGFLLSLVLSYWLGLLPLFKVCVL